MDFGKALRVARAISGMQQAEVAEKSGLDASYVSLIESGKRRPGPEAIASLSSALEMPVSLFKMLATERGDVKGEKAEDLHSLASALAELLLKPKVS